MRLILVRNYSDCFFEQDFSNSDFFHCDFLKNEAGVKHYCNYHPTTLAKWICKPCQIYYDAACMPDANEKTQLACCPKCKKPMDFLLDQAQDIPYWQVSPRFFNYPLQAEPVLVMVLMALLALTSHAHTVLGLGVIPVILWLVSYYGLRILQAELKGERQAPGLAAILSVSDLKEAISIAFILGLAIFSVLLADRFVGGGLALLVGAFWIGLLPALLMLSALESGLKESFQWDKLSKIMLNMKWAYVGLMAYLLLAVISLLVIADFARQHLPILTIAPLMAASFAYFIFALASMFGYALRSDPALSGRTQGGPSGRLGADNFYLASTITDVLKRADADLDIALKQGNYGQARALIEGDLKRHSYSDVRRDQLYKLLCAQNDYQGLGQQAHIFLWLMLGRGQIDQAAQFIQQLRQRINNFRLYDLLLCRDLAERFHALGEHELVLWLAEDAHTRCEPAPALAELYLRAAKTLLSKFNDKRRAQVYLNYINSHFADQPIAEAAKILDKLISKAPNPSSSG